MLHGLQPALGDLALSIVLRDLGNGVVRLESVRFLERPPDGLGCVPLVLPFSAMVADAISCALGALGETREFSDGLARAVSDDCTELCVW